jgi:hypothetical protein
VDVLCERLAASEAAKERYIKKYTTLNENYRALSAHSAKEEQLKEHTVSRWKEDHNALKDCRAELHSKSRELTAVRSECESLRSELGLMRSQLESSEKNISSTHTRLRESEAQRQQTERQNSELSINLDSYRKMRAELTDSIKDKEERLLAAHQMIAEFETQLRQSDEVKRQLELQVEEVTASARLALQHSQIEVRQRLHIGLEAVQERLRGKSQYCKTAATTSHAPTTHCVMILLLWSTSSPRCSVQKMPSTKKSSCSKENCSKFEMKPGTLFRSRSKMLVRWRRIFVRTILSNSRMPRPKSRACARVMQSFLRRAGRH